MKLLLENWREYLNEQVSATATEVETFTATEVETLVRDHHHNEDDFGEEGDLADRIEEHGPYKLEHVPIESIISPWEVEEARVKKYVKLATAPDGGLQTVPPIVVASNYEVIDGTHRFEAVKRLGGETIEAYVGVDNETPT